MMPSSATWLPRSSADHCILYFITYRLMMHEISGWKEAVMSGVGTDLDDRRLYSCRPTMMV